MSYDELSKHNLTLWILLLAFVFVKKEEMLNKLISGKRKTCSQSF